MKSFKIHVSFPTGTILIGGHCALPVGASSAHARGHDGLPVIPATALRGALRESLEALLRGDGRPACDSGSGIDPAINPDAEPGPCTLDGGQRCIPCRLFGTRSDGLTSGSKVFSSLILGDAVVDRESDEKVMVEWGDRQHVAISRSRRSAEDQRLFLRQIPHLHERELVAHGHLVESDHGQYLEAAVRATTHLGSGRSVGLGRVTLDLVWGDQVALASANEANVQVQDQVRVRVTLKSPTALGAAGFGDNYRPSRSEIPGSVLRGAIGFAIARTMDEPDADLGFQELVDEDTGAQFGYLYPTRGDSDATEDRIVGPWPLTARACKAHGHAHGVVDTLLDRIAVASLDAIDQVEATRAIALRECGFERCGAPLRTAKGSRGCVPPPAKRVITRVSINRRTTSARSGALFAYELLEPGAVFEGTIRGIPESARALLNSALRLPLLHVGRGASSGWGKVEVEVIPGSRGASLEQRGAEFLRAVRAHFEAASLPTSGLGRLLPITFLSPFLPDDGDGEGRRTLERALGEEIEWVVVARRFVREGGWDQRGGRPFAELAVTAGSVYVARLPEDWSSPEWLRRLETLEREGLGRRRHQGYGHLISFDPFIQNRRQTQ